MRLISLIFLSVLTFHSVAQDNYRLEINGDGYQQFQDKRKVSIKDSLEALNHIRDIQLKAISKGYLMASVDSLFFEKNSCKANFYLGEHFQKILIQLEQSEAKTGVLSEKIREKNILKQTFTPKEVAKFLSVQLENAINNGYPFASVQLTNIEYKEKFVTASLQISRGKQYEWTAIHIKGDSILSVRMISSLIGIRVGDRFSESILKNVSANIRQINYLQEIKPFEILFTEKGAELFLYLKSVPVSSVNGILGLQPNPVTERLSVTGELNLKLLNVLRRGENLTLNWRSIQAGTQSFNAGINYPFLFNSSFGLDGKFQLYKRDSTFLETRSGFGIQYLIGKGNYLKAFYQLHTSSLLSNSQSLPSLSTLNNSLYGISFLRQKVDYLPNPTKGFTVYLETAIGNRKSRLSDTLEFDRTTTVRSAVTMQWFIPISQRNVLKLGGNFESYYAPVVFSNELYRFGGLTTLRGFNEDEILASTKAILTLEYRFLTDKNSHAFAFFDQAIYENTAGNYNKDQPFGFGAGFSFGTNLGIFSISYAQGKQLNNPILLRNGKIHFGYIAYF